MDNRLLESQDKLRQIFNMAMGVYIGQEPKKKDSWRDIRYYDLWRHFKHEVGEIDRSDSKCKQLHNILDAINLLCMMGAKIIE